jgi:hypothetical protein
MPKEQVLNKNIIKHKKQMIKNCFVICCLLQLDLLSEKKNVVRQMLYICNKNRIFQAFWDYDNRNYLRSVRWWTFIHRGLMKKLCKIIYGNIFFYYIMQCMRRKIIFIMLKDFLDNFYYHNHLAIFCFGLLSFLYSFPAIVTHFWCICPH